MPDGRLERFLRRHGDVRGREYRSALALTGYFFLLTAVFYVVKPVKESLLIGAQPAWWPYAELATALLIGFVVAVNARFLDRLPRRTYLTASLVFFIASLLVFWSIFNIHRTGQVQSPVADSTAVLFSLWLRSAIVYEFPAFVIAFCFWVDVFIAMGVTQFWIAVNDVFHPHQAKRLVGLFVMGGLAGGIAGSALAALMTVARIVRAEYLLLVSPFLLVPALVAVNLVYSGQMKVDATAGDTRLAPSARVGYLESFRAVRRNGYLLELAAMIGAAVTAGTLINYQFKTIVLSAYPDRDDRTAFIAVFFLAVLGAATLFHIVTTKGVLKSSGIRWAISLAPAALALVSSAVFLIPAGLMLGWALAARGADKVFDNTLTQSVRELLYVPVAEEVKFKAKIFIDMFVNKFATGLGAALFLVLFHVRSFAYRTDGPLAQAREIGLLVLVFVALWLVLTRLVYRRYPEHLKQGRKWQPAGEAIAANVDLDRTRKVFDTIRSREIGSAVYLMNVFDLVSRSELTPDLKELLGIKRDEIKARGLDSLLDVGGAGLFPGIGDVLDDPEVRREIDLIFLLPEYQEIMARRLGELAVSPSLADRIEAAKLIGRMLPGPPVLEALGRLIGDPFSEVVLYALESAAVHRRPEHVPLILAQLGSPMTRAEAQAALAAYGPGAVDVLAPAMRDAALPPEVRRAVPEVLARVGTQRAADLLLAELARRDESMEQALVDALCKLRAERPDVRFRARDVRPELVHLVRACGGLALAGDADGAVSEGALSLRLKRVFDLLTLLHPAEDVVRIYQNIQRGTARSTDYALEHLDTMLDRELKALLLPLIEELTPGERADRLRRALRLK